MRLLDPEKAFQVGTWVPACSLPIQEARPNHPSLASLLLKSCNYSNVDRRYFKTLFLGQINYFYQLPSETTPKWERRLIKGSSDIEECWWKILTISPCEILNLATHLPSPEDSPPFHSCLETLDHGTKSQEGLSEDPLTNPEEIWYTDGSSFVLDGKRRAGYAVLSNFETVKPKPLPPGTSAQLAELIALTRALELRKGKRVAIYTDSKYAFLGLHAHTAIWK